MISSKIPYRYAKGLFILKANDEVLQQRLNDLMQLSQLFEEMPQLKRFFTDTAIPDQAKKESFAKIFGNQLDPALQKFIVLLVEKGRLPFLSQITFLYKQMVFEKLGIIEATLTSAIPVQEETKLLLKRKLEDTYHKKISFVERVDPRIIGGAIITLGDKIIDYSLKNRLAKLKSNLLAVPI